jgi:hypothetical protein
VMRFSSSWRRHSSASSIGGRAIRRSTRSSSDSILLRPQPVSPRSLKSSLGSDTGGCPRELYILTNTSACVYHCLIPEHLLLLHAHADSYPCDIPARSRKLLFVCFCGFKRCLWSVFKKNKKNETCDPTEFKQSRGKKVLNLPNLR